MRTRDERSRRTTAFVVVLFAHILILWWLALTRDAQLFEASPPIDVTLFPGSPPAGSSGSGGEAPPAPSIVHSPPVVLKPFPDAFQAPPEPTPIPQPLIVGSASIATPILTDSVSVQPGASTGAASGAGEGAGAATGRSQGAGSGLGGTGIGTGAGAGVGAGSSGVRWIRQLNAEEKNEVYPSRAARRRISGQAVILCRINRDTTVTNCRDESERPTGWGFGRAAVRAARYMRIRPRVLNGVVQDGARERITVPFTWTQGVSPEDAVTR